jgi:hypothetical protein
MSFRFSFRVDPIAITVPYAPTRDGIRDNQGFTDLRGHPDKANAIAEGNDSAALRNLLVRTAKAGSSIITLGCDLGIHSEPQDVHLARHEVAGGYVQFAASNYSHAERESYLAFANRIVAGVKPRARGQHWEIELIGQMVNFQFVGQPNGIFPSIVIWFFATAKTPSAAIRSRGRLIAAIDKAIALPSTLDVLASA